MSRKSKILVSSLTIGLVVLLFSIMFAEKGFLDLLQLKEQKHGWKVENSRIGLELLSSIAHCKRLAMNDPGIIEQLARGQGLIGQEELVLIPQKPRRPPSRLQNGPWIKENFRFLSDKEFAFLLNFDIESFKFYEELLQSE